MKAFAIILLLTLLASCGPKRDEIIPVDVQKYLVQQNGSTEDAASLGQKMQTESFNNTVGRTLPSVTVTDMNGKNINLKKAVKKSTIIIAGSPYGNLGMDEMERLFPEAVRNLGEKADDIEIICLVVSNKADGKEAAENFAAKLRSNYDNIYIIDNQEAAKMNIFANPTKLFVNKDHIVVHYSMGFVNEEEYRFQELSEGIDKMQNKRL